MSQSAPVLVTTEEDLVQKEQVGQLHFAATDVIADTTARRRRTLDIERACTLGNAHHCKVHIHFRTADGHPHRLETTIWACDADYITLKAGATLPVRSVTEVEFI